MMDINQEVEIRLNAPMGSRIRFDDTRGWETGPHIHKSVFPVIKETLKGVWVALPYGDKRGIAVDPKRKYSSFRKKFVLNGTRIAFAYPDEEQAWKSYIIRKHHQAHHLEVQLKDTKHLINLAKERRFSYTYKEWLELGEDIVEFS